MALFKFFSRKSENSASYEDIWRELLGQAASKAGIPINYKTVMQLTTAQSCARVIAEDIAQLPYKLYKSRPNGGSDVAIDHPVNKLIKLKPNEWQTSFEFRETIALHLVLTNNAYVLINRFTGRIVELLPFEPHLVKPVREGWETKYVIKLEDGSSQTLTKKDIWHLKGPSWNGWQGLDGIRLMRECVGLALALEQHGSKMFSNGATVGGLLSTDQPLNDKQREDLRKSWESRHQGSENAYKTAVMWGGMKYTPMASGNDQAQYLETRRFQVEETCRAFKVMPIMVGHSDKTSTFASAAQMRLTHHVNTMNPWWTRIEQSADCNLLTDDEIAQGYYTKFTRNALMASTPTERADYFTKLYNVASLNPNEIRDYEDLNPYEGGDEYRAPLNMETPGSTNTDTGNQDNGN